jgi:hypothetical protein
MAAALADDRWDVGFEQLSDMKYTFVVIDSPDGQYLMDAVVADQMGDGVFDIVDLR